jgi:phosphoribosylaminoimidazole (AIR) synthetase
MGIGMAMVVSPYYAQSVVSRLVDSGQVAYEIGEIVPGTGKVRL